jgi:ribonuclease G
LSNELIISGTQDGCRIALLKDKTLVEFHQESEGSKFTVGDIYLGMAKKVVPGLNAAFIDVGYDKDAFLHYLDLGPQFGSLQKFTKLVRAKKINGARLDKFQSEPDIDKHGKITAQLSKNQVIPVQIVKEPISTKGPRLSCELSLAGRYLVLVPFSNAVSVSKKITSSEERKRLLRLIQSIKPENFGVIIRTVAENKEVAELDKDLRNLVKTWEEGRATRSLASLIKPHLFFAICSTNRSTTCMLMIKRCTMKFVPISGTSLPIRKRSLSYIRAKLKSLNITELKSK